MDLGYVKRGFKREVVCCAMFARKAVRTPVSQGAVPMIEFDFLNNKLVML